MKKISQTNNAFPIQSIEDYQTNGPSKTETSSGNAYTDCDTKFMLDFISVRRLYNKLREEGYNHGKAWKKSKANMLPIGDQLAIKREIQEKNPHFYQEAGLTLYSQAAKIEKKSKIDEYWNIIYTDEDIDKLNPNT